MMGPRKSRDSFPAAAVAEVLCTGAASAASLSEQGEAPLPAAALFQKQPPAQAASAGASPAKRSGREAGGTPTKQRDATPGAGTPTKTRAPPAATASPSPAPSARGGQ